MITEFDSWETGCSQADAFDSPRNKQLPHDI